MAAKTAKPAAERAKTMNRVAVIDEMRRHLAEAATDYPGEPKKAMQWKLARAFEMTPRRVRAFLNNEVRQVAAEEYLTIKQKTEERRKRRMARLRAELETLEARYANARAALYGVDSDEVAGAADLVGPPEDTEG